MKVIRKEQLRFFHKIDDNSVEVFPSLSEPT